MDGGFTTFPILLQFGVEKLANEDEDDEDDDDEV
jgi:hypothetical protein